MKVEVSDQVLDFVRGRAPEPRQRLRQALRRLETGRGDIRALEGPLKGFHRLRVGAFRILFVYAPGADGSPAARCLFAETRDVVYEMFLDRLKAALLRDAT